VTPESPPRRIVSGVVRWTWIGVGFASVGIGAIGVVVPGLPTTVFFVVAAWCFGRSSPRFEAWVLGLPKIGPLVQDHRDGLGMPRRAKVIAVSMMSTAVIVSAVLSRHRPALAVGLIIAGLIGAVVVTWWVPTRERVLAERAAAADDA
jgi:uncharacterized protein